MIALVIVSGWTGLLLSPIGCIGDHPRQAEPAVVSGVTTFVGKEAQSVADGGTRGMAALVPLWYLFAGAVSSSTTSDSGSFLFRLFFLTGGTFALVACPAVREGASLDKGTRGDCTETLGLSFA